MAERLAVNQDVIGSSPVRGAGVGRDSFTRLGWQPWLTRQLETAVLGP
jgi:hypothetical protein